MWKFPSSNVSGSKKGRKSFSIAPQGIIKRHITQETDDSHKELS